MSKELKADHERIWLQPKCCAGEYEGRQWCQDNVFDDGQCEDGAKATEYIRADLASRTPTEPGEAEVAKQLAAIGLGDGEFFVNGDTFDLVFAPKGTCFVNAHMVVGRFACGETAYKLPGIVATLLNAALRSTTPATDVVEAENYASEFVKGEAPADVSRAAVDEDALVEWLRSHAKYVKSLIGAGKGTLFFDADIEKLNTTADRLQSLQASIRVMRNLLDRSLLFVVDRPVPPKRLEAEIRAILSQPIGGE